MYPHWNARWENWAINSTTWSIILQLNNKKNFNYPQHDQSSFRDNYRYGQKKKKRKRDKTDDPGIWKTLFLFGSKMNGWTLVWGVPIHLFESFSHPRLSIFSVLAPVQQWRSVPNFYFLSFVVCLLSSRPDPRPRGGSLSVDGGVPGPSNSLFVCFLHPPTHTHTHPHVITVHWPRYHWRPSSNVNSFTRLKFLPFFPDNLKDIWKEIEWMLFGNFWL